MARLYFLPKGRDVLLRSSLPGLYGVDGTASLTNVSLEFEGKLVSACAAATALDLPDNIAKMFFDEAVMMIRCRKI